jgi:hypothetical protein
MLLQSSSLLCLFAWVARKQADAVSVAANATASQVAAIIARGGAAAAAASSAGLNGTQPFLFIGVLSQPAAIERRRAVRETWMSTASPEVAFKFVLYQVRSQNPENLALDSLRALPRGKPHSLITTVSVNASLPGIWQTWRCVCTLMHRSQQDLPHSSRLNSHDWLHAQAEATPATLEEAAAHGDLIFVEGGGQTDYRSIVYKTFALVQWVLANLEPKFILKTDDDAYVHTANLVHTLRAVRRLQHAAGRLLVHGTPCIVHPGCQCNWHDGSLSSNLSEVQHDGL